MLCSVGSVQEPVFVSEGECINALHFFVVHTCSALGIDGIKRGEGGREGEQVRSAGCLSAWSSRH